MADQEYVQRTIRAYISISVMMNSRAVLSPKTRSFFRDLGKNLEQEIATFRSEEPLEGKKAA